MFIINIYIDLFLFILTNPNRELTDFGITRGAVVVLCDDGGVNDTSSTTLSTASYINS